MIRIKYPNGAEVFIEENNEKYDKLKNPLSPKETLITKEELAKAFDKHVLYYSSANQAITLENLCKELGF